QHRHRHGTSPRGVRRRGQGHVGRHRRRPARPGRRAGPHHHLHLHHLPSRGAAVSRVLSTVAAAALAVGLCAGGAHAAVPYDESIHMSWDGTTYTGVTTESFLGTPVAVPGDSASRTVLVRNDGPATGTLRASIVNVDLLDPAAPDVHHAGGEDLG